MACSLNVYALPVVGLVRICTLMLEPVVATHGATVGALDPNALFYLMSRGINPTQARYALILGFINEIVEQIKSPDLQTYLLNQFKRKLQGEVQDAI